MSWRGVTLILLASLSLVGADAPARRVATSADTPDVASFRSPTVAPLTRIGIAVTLIGALGWGLSWYARRRMRSRSGVSAEIQVLGQRGLGPRHRLALVSVADRHLLVGMGPDSITTLADLSDAPSFAQELDARIPAAKDDPRSSDLLTAFGPAEGLDA